MSIVFRQKLEEIYKRYGFEIAKFYEIEQVIVFTLKTGYFDNADIVPLSTASATEKAFSDFSKSGYACTIREVLTPEEAEDHLFKGFFSVESTLLRLKADYRKFTQNIVAPFSAFAVYEYMNAPYVINGKKGELSPADEVINRIADKKPTLFLIEAAAGFGKTCTAYELVNKLTEQGEYLPLFSELSRNRQARVFRYILLDEIDRTFPVLGSRLVQAEMINGRVVTILDGFDELLRKSDDGNEFENREPMLETIGEFLTGNAKIVLTTRRTVLFEGDAFHSWVDKHINDFDLVRIRINEPDISDWLPPPRLSTLEESNLNTTNLANPVLLSYLRCITDSAFDTVMQTPHALVDRYFEFMLERERTRQDLRMDPTTQAKILSTIADDMIAYGYTSEHRDYVVDHIQKLNSKIIDESLLAYTSSERPTREEIANKLASHALLDRSNREPNKIGFINEFVFGHFIALNILRDNEWLSDDLRFIEPAVVSYQPRSQDVRNLLWSNLQNSTEYLPVSERIDISIRLKNSVDFELSNDAAEGLEMDGILIGGAKIDNFQFSECVFRRCSFDLSNISNTTFLTCRFYDCDLVTNTPNGQIHLLGSSGDSDFISRFLGVLSTSIKTVEPDRQLLLNRHVLEKFWPVGRETFIHKHRPIKMLCFNTAEFRPTELFETINFLKKQRA